VGDYHPNVIGALDVLQDEDYLYIVMTFCTGGALSGQISEDPQKRIPEPKARVWFKQLLSGMRHLQRKGICHQDLSLENILIDREDNLVIIDLGMALRIPYSDPANIGHVTDISEGTERCLILSQYQGTGRSQLYLAPELVAGLEAFDGFAIDLWALGVILFLLLVGIPPFTSADSSDERFEKISEGGLKEVLIKDNISISEEAIDLLQNMLWQDPRKRLGLSQIFRHPWVKGTRLPACIVTSNYVEENEESGDSEQNKSPFPSLPIPNLQDLQSWFSLGSN
jgi:serine/threonine protein kinase